jgi:hypothetical protein
MFYHVKSVDRIILVVHLYSVESLVVHLYSLDSLVVHLYSVDSLVARRQSLLQGCKRPKNGKRKEKTVALQRENKPKTISKLF